MISMSAKTYGRRIRNIILKLYSTLEFSKTFKDAFEIGKYNKNRLKSSSMALRSFYMVHNKILKNVYTRYECMKTVEQYVVYDAQFKIPNALNNQIIDFIDVLMEFHNESNYTVYIYIYFRLQFEIIILGEIKR